MIGGRRTGGGWSRGVRVCVVHVNNFKSCLCEMWHLNNAAGAIWRDQCARLIFKDWIRGKTAGEVEQRCLPGKYIKNSILPTFY